MQAVLKAEKWFNDCADFLLPEKNSKFTESNKPAYKGKDTLRYDLSHFFLEYWQ